MTERKRARSQLFLRGRISPPCCRRRCSCLQRLTSLQRIEMLFGHQSWETMPKQPVSNRSARCLCKMLCPVHPSMRRTIQIMYSANVARYVGKRPTVSLQGPAITAPNATPHRKFDVAKLSATSETWKALAVISCLSRNYQPKNTEVSAHRAGGGLHPMKRTPSNLQKTTSLSRRPMPRQYQCRTSAMPLTTV